MDANTSKIVVVTMRETAKIARTLTHQGVRR
jgi:hypothetical protein